ncbi:MAG: transporter ATP-binding protein [Tardiphaga sp.]|jgi:branched-chain amino acid transport system ATP-binding protein|uniref:ABC transporter ATP-binding protein n=1 Tax=Tardiphaga sp. TaxID=1926292 RepID=UPI00262301F0|nr:ABC transporter ATP-binding protein [Tardiphaga sp.]MDB5503784.1 transporter ATP-binding protein [Tardiphaga sp.]
MLEVQDLHTFYGESHVLQGVSLSVAPSQCVALLGRNGAGKTTTLRSILGLTPARRGEVTFKGEVITRKPTHQIVRLGVSYVPEDRGIFATVTVEEHLAMARGASRGRPARKDIGYVFEVFPRLAERRHSLGGQLSGGEQQMLAIGRALIAGPDLLVLDEPSEGLAPVIIEKLEEVLLAVKRMGVPILIVEQNYHLATRLADYVYVLSQGSVKFAGATEALTRDENIRRTYLSV